MTKTILSVTGMTCGACVKRVRTALAFEGVGPVDVQLASRTVAIEHQASISIGQLVEALRQAGYEATPSLQNGPARVASRTGCCCG